MPTDERPLALPAAPSAPQAVLERFEMVAQQTYFDLQAWAAALQLWRTRAELGPPNIETQLALAHCRVEIASAAELADIAIPNPTTASNGNRDLHLHVMRCRAYELLQAGDAPRAAQIMRLVAAADPHLRRIYDEAILASGSTASADMPQPVDLEGKLPFQSAFDLDEPAAHAVIARHRHRRVLFAMRSGDAPSKADVPRNLTNSLSALGIKWTGLNGMPGTDARDRLVDDLRAGLAEARPDVVVYDDMFVSGPAGESGTWERILEVLDAARRAHGTKLVYTHPDAWYDGMDELYNAAFNLGDLFHMPHPALLRRLSPAAAERVFCHPYPVSDPPGAPTAPRRRLHGSFVGSLNWTTPSRLAWCAEIANADLPVDIHLSTAHARSAAEYVELIGDYAIGVNFTARSNDTRILTQRTTEIPCFGSLLLEEDSADTPYFMRPFDHYVPFTTLAELRARLRQLIEEPELRGRITRSGTSWARRYFTGLHFWAGALHRLYEVERRPAVPSKPAKAVHIRIPGPPDSVIRYMNQISGARS